jgi:hypothetical protein
MRTFAPEMRKALMYLSLSLGIILVVMFVCGAVLGFAGNFIEGFIDGFRGDTNATWNPSDFYFAIGMGILCIACIILQIVFLRMRFASYTMGRMPKDKRRQVISYTGMAMYGLALLNCTISDPFFSNDESLRESYAWIAKHPISSLIGMAFIEATADLIIYGGMMREILEWKHRPQIIVPAFALIIGLTSAFFSAPVLAIITTMTVMFQGYLYDFTRSVIPIIFGDIIYWLIIVLLTGLSIPAWCFFIAAILFVPGAYLALQTMEPFRPID